MEELINSLISNNENTGKYKFIIYSTYDKDAEEQSKKYRHTTFRYIKNLTQYAKIKYLVYCFFRKIFNKRILRLNDFDYSIYKYIQKDVSDLVIVEGGAFIHEYKTLSDLIGHKKMVLHIHAVFEAPAGADQIFGHAIAISNYVKSVWQMKSNMDVFVLRNCYLEKNFTFQNMEHIASVIKKTQLGFHSDDAVFLYVGRIIEVKGVYEFCNAILHCSNEKIKACIVGSSNYKDGRDTEYFQKIQKLSKESNGKIIMTGFIPNDQLFDVYQAVDVQVVPSIWEEGAGMVTIEGMANGLPLIVTDSGGIHEYANPEGTIVVHRSNLENELIDAMQYLMDPVIRMQMGAKNRVYAQQFNSVNYYKNFSTIVDEIMESE